MAKIRKLLTTIANQLGVKADESPVVFHAEPFVGSVDPRKITVLDLDGGKAIDVLGETGIVATVRTTNHERWGNDGMGKNFAGGFLQDPEAKIGSGRYGGRIAIGQGFGRGHGDPRIGDEVAHPLGHAGHAFAGEDADIDGGGHAGGQ